MCIGYRFRTFVQPGDVEPKRSKVLSQFSGTATGIENAVATPAITAALYARFVSRQDDSPAMKAVAAMRNQFGGHATRAAAEGEPGPDPDLA